MPRSRTEQRRTAFAFQVLLSKLQITKENFAKLRRDGHMSLVVALPGDGEPEVVQVHLIHGQSGKDFVNTTTCIQQCLKQRPDTRLEKPIRAKRKKKSNLKIRNAA